jgi:hypothetical protein
VGQRCARPSAVARRFLPPCRAKTLEIGYHKYTRVHAGMKSRSCIIWVLGLLLVIASVDTIPDPPALNPRSVSVALLCEARGDVCERLNSGWIISSLVQVRWIAFTSAYEPKLPTDWIALTGLATDPSPPTL